MYWRLALRVDYAAGELPTLSWVESSTFDPAWRGPEKERCVSWVESLTRCASVCDEPRRTSPGWSLGCTPRKKRHNVSSTLERLSFDSAVGGFPRPCTRSSSAPVSTAAAHEETRMPIQVLVAGYGRVKACLNSLVWCWIATRRHSDSNTQALETLP